MMEGIDTAPAAPPDKLQPTPELRWFHDGDAAALQQRWADASGHHEEWRPVPTVCHSDCRCAGG